MATESLYGRHFDRKVMKKLEPTSFKADEWYVFSIGKSTSVRIFDFEVPADVTRWRTSILIKTHRNEPIPLSRSVIFPADNRSIGSYLRTVEDNLSPRALDDLAMLIYRLDLAVRKAHKTSTERLDVFNGEQSLDLENWPITLDRETYPVFAPSEGYTHLYGTAGAGKSLLAHNIGIYAAAGLPFLGYRPLDGSMTAPIIVYYLSLEMYYNEFRERHNIMLQSFPKRTRENFLFTCERDFDIARPADLQRLRNTIVEHSVQLLIVDSHSEWRGGLDPNSNQDMQKLMQPVIAMLKDHGMSLILIDHTGWAGNHPSGAKWTWNKASVGCWLKMPEEYGAEGETEDRMMGFNKWRYVARQRPRATRLVLDPDKLLLSRATETVLVDLIDHLSLPATPAEVAKQLMHHLGLKERQARNKREELVERGYLMRDGQSLRLPDDYDNPKEET